MKENSISVTNDGPIFFYITIVLFSFEGSVRAPFPLGSGARHPSRGDSVVRRRGDSLSVEGKISSPFEGGSLRSLVGSVDFWLDEPFAAA